MKYEDIKKMGEAYAQVQEKMRQENAKRAEAMVQAEAKKVEKEMSDMEKTRAMASNPPKKDKQDTKNRPPSELMNQKEGAKQGKSIKGTIQPGKKIGIKSDASNDQSDDGDGMDKVDPKAVKKKFKDRKDKDIDNDGDTDNSDEYLHKRRKAISKNSESKGKKEVEVQTQEDLDAMMRKRKDDKAKAIAKRNTSPSDIMKQKMYRQKMDRKRQQNNSVEEAASTGAGKNSDSVAQDKTDGLAPNAKKELARATNEPAVDAEKSNKLNFATFKKMTKKSKDNG